MPSEHEQKEGVIPEKKIAIIRPFIPQHTEELVEDLMTWNDAHSFPCSTENGGTKKKKQPVDLIFYFSYDIDTHPAGPKAKKLLEQSWYFSQWKDCFNTMKFLSAGLNSSTDRYRPQDDTNNPASGFIYKKKN